MCCTGFFISFFNEYGGFSIIKGTEGNCLEMRLLFTSYLFLEGKVKVITLPE